MTEFGRRELGNSGLQVSPVALGTWELSGMWGDDTSAAESAYRHALDSGINFFDTAMSYGAGRAEEALGALVRDVVTDRRDDVVLLTKAGVSRESGSPERNSEPDFLRRCIEGSLSRLGVDQVDLFLIHWPDPSIPMEATAAVVQGFVDQGLTRFVGVSNHSLEQMEQFATGARISAVQLPLSIFHREAHSDITDYCVAHEIAFLGHAPLAHGLLSGGLRPDTKFAADDWRTLSPAFSGPGYEAMLAAAESLKSVAAGESLTLPQLALAWVHSLDRSVFPVLGIQAPEHVDSAAAAWSHQLPLPVMAEIERLVSQLPPVASGGVPLRNPPKEA